MPHLRPRHVLLSLVISAMPAWGACSASDSGSDAAAGADKPGFAALTAPLAPAPLCEGASKRGADDSKTGGAGGPTSGASGAAGSGTSFGGSPGTAGSAHAGKGGLPGGSAGASQAGGSGGSGGGVANVGGAGGSENVGGAGGAATSCAGAAGAAGDAGAPSSMSCAGAAGASGTSGAGGASGTSGAAGAQPSPPPPPPPDGTPQSCGQLDLAKPYTLYMSPDDSNSMASPAIVRSLLRSGQQVPRRMVRTHEFLNYYRVPLPAPADGRLGLTAQLGSCDLSSDLAFQIGVRSPAASDRAPMHVVLVLDTSGSMSGAPMARERAAVRAIAKALRAGDVVSAVTWSTTQSALLSGHDVTGADDPALLGLAASLEAGGGTDLSGGLTAGYAEAALHRQPGVPTRVVLISDGQANAGITDEATIAKNADAAEGEGSYLVGVGVGRGINDTLMDAVTDAGRGAYVFLDSEEEAERVLFSRFDETMRVFARDVQISVTLPPYFGIAKFSGEIFSTDQAKVRPQHLAPDDAMVLYQLLTPCDASLVDANDHVRVDVTWKHAVTGAPEKLTRDATLGELAAQPADLTKAAAIVAYAAAARSIESGSDAERASLKNKALVAVAAADPGASDPELVEIRELVGLIP